MKKIFYPLFLFAFALSLVFVNKASASSIPTISLNTTTGSSVVQVVVMGADPNVSAVLYYQSGSSVQNKNIGTTDGNGYLSTTVDSSVYGITIGSQAYVKTNGQISNTLNWPNYTSSGSLSLSQSSVTLSVGQNMVVLASVSSGVSVTNNTNSTVASVTVSGSQINISALNSGISTATVCATNIGCANINITVASNGTAVPASIYISQNSLSLTTGQSQTISISGSGNYYLSSNSNPGIATASISGNSLNITALSSVGSTNISLCSSSSVGGTVCTGLVLTVTQPLASNTNVTANPTFGQTQVTLLPTQSQDVPIYGTGNYTISSNSSPDIVSANIGTNNNLSLYGVKSGGSNISVCQMSGGCSNIYVYVNSTTGVSSQTTQIPTLSSFSVSSTNSNNNFAGAGSTLSLTFNTSQAVTTPSVTINGSTVNVSGNGSGPYTASYAVTGNESSSIPVSVSFNNIAGTGGQASFTINNVTKNSNSALASASPSSSSKSPSVSSKASVFTKTLKVGSKGVEVTALQKLLKKDGFYTGSISGTFDTATKNAVKKYQAKHKLSQVGSVGPATRNLLNKEE